MEISQPKLVELPKPVRQSRNGIYEMLNMQAVEKDQSVFVPNAVNSETGETERTFEQQLRGVANRLNNEYSTLSDRPALKADGSPKLDSKGQPAMERDRERHFIVREIEDGVAYGKKFAGRAGFIIIRDL